MPNKLTCQFIGMLIAKLGILSITNLAKLIPNTKVIYLIPHLQEAEGNFGNIRSKHKEKCGIPSLSVDGKEYSSPKEKANILNNYFKSVFTNEDLSTIPNVKIITFLQFHCLLLE